MELLTTFLILIGGHKLKVSQIDQNIIFVWYFIPIMAISIKISG
jgi:hypothetical protein